jgi:hypothetical protein
MRFTPWKCPQCGEPAKGTLERIYGFALLTFDASGEATYAGDTEIDGNSQMTCDDESGRVLLECSARHRWPAERDDPENAEIENVPCIACGRNDLPLHTSGRCGACGPAPTADAVRTYSIEQYELHSQKYRVEATSEAEAIAKIYAGEGEAVIGTLEYIEVAHDYGMPTEEHPEIVKALEERGVDVDDAIIESIRSIEVV